MVVHGVIYQTRFPVHKVMIAAMISLGVLLFTLASSTRKASNTDGQIWLGISQLGLSMLLDGVTNSTQDQLFKYQRTHRDKIHVKINGIILMCILNLLIMINTIVYTLVTDTHHILYVATFINSHPQVAKDIINYGLLGATGQVFIFILLEKFDSIVLTTATVTRKMLSMICSVVLFGHSLNLQQILGVLLVFIGIGYEGFKSKSKPKKD